ncbi:MAG: glycosyltransferase [Bacteroidetes bacterium]|nr:MAG: glycosyltransferase [Bacteroidota bacterium]
MRIFILLSRIPYPLEKGDKLRAFHQLRELSKKNEIILCALNPNPKLDKQKAFRALQPYCRSINFLDLPWYGRGWNMLLSFFMGLPFQCGYFYNNKAASKVKKLIKEYNPDHIYCQLVRTAEYLKDINIPKTIDYQDVFSYGMKRRINKSPFYARPFMKMEYKRLLAYEEKVFDIFDNTTIISFPDQKLIPHPKRDKIHVIPNGVDHDFFSPRTAKKKYDLLFTGNMAYPPNVDAAEFLSNEIMPLVWKSKPDAKLMLAGASPDKRVLALKSESIAVSGWMDDIRDAYASARIFIAPMRIGTGLQNKLLEAMSMKIPSITTPLANDALQAADRQEILIGKNANELAENIVDLLNDEGLHQKISENGYVFVKKNYSWEEATEKLNQIFSGKSID